MRSQPLPARTIAPDVYEAAEAKARASADFALGSLRSLAGVRRQKRCGSDDVGDAFVLD